MESFYKKSEEVDTSKRRAVRVLHFISEDEDSDISVSDCGSEYDPRKDKDFSPSENDGVDDVSDGDDNDFGGRGDDGNDDFGGRGDDSDADGDDSRGCVWGRGQAGDGSDIEGGMRVVVLVMVMLVILVGI